MHHSIVESSKSKLSDILYTDHPGELPRLHRKES